MSIRNRFRQSRMAINLLAIVTATSLAAYSWAAPDYSRIKKDINVMIGIVKSSFKNDQDCKHCNVNVTGHYLAEQGVVFNVRTSGRSMPHSYAYDTDINRIVIDGLAGLPDMVTEIIAEVRSDFDGDDMHNWSWHFGGDNDWGRESRESREIVRELNRELRELSRDLREIEIEAIHAEAGQLAELQVRQQEIETELEATEQKHDEVQRELKSYADERSRDRESKRAKREQERLLQFEKMESIVLNIFCDYSRTMHNLPGNERVSIIVNKDNDSSNIYVFKQSQLESCDSATTDVRKNALSYAF